MPKNQKIVIDSKKIPKIQKINFQTINFFYCKIPLLLTPRCAHNIFKYKNRVKTSIQLYPLKQLLLYNYLNIDKTKEVQNKYMH